MAYKLWKLIITILITVGVGILLPFLNLIPDLDGNSISSTFSASNTSKLLWTVFALQLFNCLLAAVSLVENKTYKTIGWVLNTMLTIAIIIFASILTITEVAGKFPLIIMALVLLGTDCATTVVANTIKVAAPTQVSVTSTVPSPELGSGIALKDSTELRSRIQNMQSGLNKSFEEAVDEIEKTGSLSGIKIGSLNFDSRDEQNKIVPLTLEEIRQNEVKEQVKNAPQAQATTNQQANYFVPSRNRNDQDYESIHETALSRKAAPDQSYLSKNDIDEWDAH